MLDHLEVDHVNKNQDFMQPKPAIPGPQLARGRAWQVSQLASGAS
jgi:hypothetical protein